jgi:hypothetical protein
MEQVAFVPAVTLMVVWCHSVIGGRIPPSLFLSHSKAFLSNVAVRNKIMTIVLANWALRSVSHVLNFKLLNSKNRLLFFNSMQILLNMITSLVLNSCSFLRIYI